MWIKMAVSITLTSALVACIDLGDDNNQEHGQVQLKEAGDSVEFKQYLMQSFVTLAPERNYSSCPECAVDTVTEAMQADGAEDADSIEFSGTNLQESGVDESDVWKYDGENFYVLKPASWERVDVQCVTEPCYPEWVATPATIRIVNNSQQTLATIDLGEQSASDLYLNDEQLVMVDSGHPYYATMDAMIEPYYAHAEGSARIKTWDVSNVADPQLESDIEVDGQIQRTRRIGDDLFIVSRFSPRLDNVIEYPRTEEDIYKNKNILHDIVIEDLLPKIRINGEEKSLVKASDCMVVETPNNYWFGVSVTAITKLNTKTNSFSSRCISGPVDGIYMTTNNLYLYAHSYYSFETQEDDSIAWDWNGGNTHIHQFSLSDSNFQYMGSALLPGLSGYDDANFRYGELSDGSLAVVTSTNEWSDPTHRLTVLKSDDGLLQQVAQLPNAQRPQAIGKPGERIYSVRFMQNRAYIVTFQKVDPLYAIDLSNPSDPKIAGELEIPGFSEYLHPVGDDLLIGIGKGAIVGESGTTWFQGIKVSLFDVGDMSDPKELDVIDIGKRGSHTALAHEHHAFTGIEVNGEYRFGFPISVNDGEARGNYWGDPESQFYHWSYSGLHMFKIKDNQLKLEGALVTDRAEGSDTYGNWNTRRGLIQGDDVYHLSGGDLYKANWNTLDQLIGPF